MTADLVIVACAAGVRRAVGPTSWVALEEMLLASEPAGDGPASTRSCALSVRDLARRLGLDKDTVARAVQRLIDAGYIARSQTRTTAGTFDRTTYRIVLPDGLHLLDGYATPDLPADPRRPAPFTSRTNSATTDSTSTTDSTTTSPSTTRIARSSSPTISSSQLSFLEL